MVLAVLSDSFIETYITYHRTHSHNVYDVVAFGYIHRAARTSLSIPGTFITPRKPSQDSSPAVPSPIPGPPGRLPVSVCACCAHPDPWDRGTRDPPGFSP